MHCAFHALFHHRAGHFVGIVDIAVEVVVVRAATARANEFCKAIFAFLSREKAGIFEKLSRVFTGNPFKYTAHTEFFIPRELMARI